MNRALLPEGWDKPKGYANAVAAKGTQIYVAGQIGWNPATSAFETDDFVAQIRQALSNIAALLKEGGAGPEHLVRLTWFVTDKAEYAANLREIGGAYRDVLGRNFPAMTLVEVKSLLEPRAKVEIEATAVVPDRA
ncbi:MAG: RidA family protein [Alphaproteobacteria bacterium]|nr:RidA family protein [Alphaproteobacteria bacterium]